MHFGRTVFAQVMEHFPACEFQRCVTRYDGDLGRRSFSCLDQFLCLSFAQLTYGENWRDIEACLRSVQGKLHHMGFRGRIARFHASGHQRGLDWRIYADFAQVLIATAPTHVRPGVSWLRSRRARFQSTKGEVKMHTLLDLRGSIPTFIEVSDGKLHDVNLLDEILPEAGSFYVMDRGYLDFERLCALHRCDAFFVTRTKSAVLLRRRYSRAVDKTTGLRSDHTATLTSAASLKNYPDLLRRVRFTTWSSVSRWKVELFFKWIKQHLRIKVFYGNSENAVVVAIVKNRLALDATLYQILHVLSVTLFEKTRILRAFDKQGSQEQFALFFNQLNLPDF
jgi:hypothetical protein